MNQNQNHIQNRDKTICCRIDQDMYELLEALTQHKGIKLSTFMRETLTTATALELKRMNIINTSQVKQSLQEAGQKKSTPNNEQNES